MTITIAISEDQVQSSYQLLYFDLIPPSPFLREANKVAAWFWICTVAVALAWSFGVFVTDPFRGITTDFIVVGASIAEVWYLSLVTTSYWRLMEYRKAAPQLSNQLYQLLYPWAGVLVINTTMLVLALIDRATSSPEAGRTLYKVFLAEIAPLAAFEVPILKNWLPRFDPLRFVKIFEKGLSVSLGREKGVKGEKHARQVVEFQYEFAQYVDRIDMKASPTAFSEYSDASDLASFQRTLSCLYETSKVVGLRVDSYFKKRNWTMLDIGGGEGIFASEVLACCSTLPQILTVIDPAETNVLEYRDRMTASFPSIRNVDACVGTVELMIDDLPIVNFLIASHSLYGMLEQSKRRAPSIIAELLKKTRDGITLFIMASKDSYLYTIKRTVLSHLHRIDRSSYGEDLTKLLPPGVTYHLETLDSLVDVTAIVDEYEGLISWLAYFCRVQASEVRPYFDTFQTLVRDTAIEIRNLPYTEKVRIEQSQMIEKMHLQPSSKVIFHKEVILSIPSERRITRPGTAEGFAVNGDFGAKGEREVMSELK